MSEYRIIPLDRTKDDFGVYSSRERGIYNTPLVYRGTMVQCRKFVREGK